MRVPNLLETGVYTLDLTNVVLRKVSAGTCWDLDLQAEFSTAAADGNALLPEFFEQFEHMVSGAVQGKYPLDVRSKLEEPVFVEVGGPISTGRVQASVVEARLKATRGEATLTYRVRVWAPAACAPQFADLWGLDIDVRIWTAQTELFEVARKEAARG